MILLLTEFAWVWSLREEGGQVGSVVLGERQRQITFNPEYSTGTATVRGQHPLSPGNHHYWELKMTSAVYGTDIVCSPVLPLFLNLSWSTLHHNLFIHLYSLPWLVLYYVKHSVLRYAEQNWEWIFNLIHIVSQVRTLTAFFSYSQLL